MEQLPIDRKIDTASSETGWGELWNPDEAHRMRSLDPEGYESQWRTIFMFTKGDQRGGESQEEQLQKAE